MAEGYTITAQRQTVGVTPGGQTVDMMEIEFVTDPEEVYGSVRVALASYNAGTVDAEISKRVAEIKAVAGL